jgi:DNA-binding MarR family transcriptional regulator
MAKRPMQPPSSGARGESAQCGLGFLPPVLRTLFETAGAIEDRFEEELEAVGLSVAKYFLLTQLGAEREPLALGALAARLSCVRSNITQLVDRLEGEGLVRRVDDPADRRVVRASLTPLGLRRQLEGRRIFERVASSLIETLSSGEQKMLVRALSSLRAESAARAQGVNA